MIPLDLNEACEWVSENIDGWHQNRIRLVTELTLNNLIKKNPYLFRAKHITKASELIDDTMAALQSSSEEKEFGDFLESLAIFVAERTLNGHASGTTGVDLELNYEGTHYFISIKSGTNWGNSSQLRKLGENFQEAIRVFRNRGNQRVPVDAILGISYGNVRTNRHSRYGYLKLVGQNFWTFISGNRRLYTDIIEPLGYRAEIYKEKYKEEKDKVTNLITREFIERFCDQDGTIDWHRLVEENSGNFDLDRHGFDF
jgi:hypothetical protein